jgi:hypothetical protein
LCRQPFLISHVKRDGSLPHYLATLVKTAVWIKLKRLFLAHNPFNFFQFLQTLERIQLPTFNAVQFFQGYINAANAAAANRAVLLEVTAANAQKFADILDVVSNE